MHGYFSILKPVANDQDILNIKKYIKKYMKHACNAI